MYVTRYYGILSLGVNVMIPVLFDDRVWKVGKGVYNRDNPVGRKRNCVTQASVTEQAYCISCPEVEPHACLRA